MPRSRWSCRRYSTRPYASYFIEVDGIHESYESQPISHRLYLSNLHLINFKKYDVPIASCQIVKFRSYLKADIEQVTRAIQTTDGNQARFSSTEMRSLRETSWTCKSERRTGRIPLSLVAAHDISSSRGI